MEGSVLAEPQRAAECDGTPDPLAKPQPQMQAFWEEARLQAKTRAGADVYQLGRLEESLRRNLALSCVASDRDLQDLQAAFGAALALAADVLGRGK